MSKDEIERMTKEAEIHAKEDEEKKEQIEARNTADSLIFTSEKTLKDGEGKISEATKKEVEEKISALKEIGVSTSLWVNLRMRAFGSTTSESIESDPFVYPLAICEGCLVASVQPCPVSAAPNRTGNPCNIAQDAPVDCCQSGSDLVCPSVVSQ